MRDFLISLLAALGLALGVAALTTLVARTERFPRFGVLSFVVTAILLLGTLLVVDLPTEAALSLGVGGAGLGLLALLGLGIAMHIERREGL